MKTSNNTRFPKELFFEPISIDSLMKEACKATNENPEDYKLLLGNNGMLAVYEDDGLFLPGKWNTYTP